MKILLLGHREIASNIALSLIVAGLPEHEFDVMLSGPVPMPDGTPPQLAALASLEQSLCDDLRSPELAAATGVLSFEELAARGGGEVGTLARPNSPEGLRQLEKHEPELVISVRYRRILKEAVIAMPLHGVLNLHSGLLPDYRGMMVTFWAMLNDEQTIGSTLHRIVDGGIDTGPIIARASGPVNRDWSYLANVLALYRPGCGMIVEAVRRIDCRKLPPGAAQDGPGTYYSMPSAPDIARFESAGLRLFDGNELQQWGRTSANG